MVEEIGVNLLLAVVVGIVGAVAMTVAWGRFNMRARITRKPDGTVEVDEAGDQSIGLDSNDAQIKAAVVKEGAVPNQVPS